ncbi:hypothetical protein [Sphingomonas lutea]|uniref:hypothetical protein n=1 Tax=Sphingomonas lutea TaxID=1045317 RepID=UPI001FD450A8|nr:hypothetical protein [Sphingomonas lutea]
MTSGYSGTPLARKLSLKDKMRVWWDGVPNGVRGEIRAGLEDQGAAIELLDIPKPPIDAAHIFVTARGELEAKLHLLMPLLAPAASSGSAGPRRRQRSRPT